MEPLDRDEDVPGLWKGTITLDEKGLDDFQIVGDAVDTKVYFPNVPNCTMKAVPIQFGTCSEREHSWRIMGQEGDDIRIEFFQSGSFRSVNWYKVEKGSR